jgi:hypothetical protein
VFSINLPHAKIRTITRPLAAFTETKTGVEGSSSQILQLSPRETSRKLQPLSLMFINPAMNDYLATPHRFKKDLFNKKLHSFDEWFGQQNESATGIGIDMSIGIGMEDGHEQDENSKQSAETLYLSDSDDGFALKRQQKRNSHYEGALENLIRSPALRRGAFEGGRRKLRLRHDESSNEKPGWEYSDIMSVASTVPEPTKRPSKSIDINNGEPRTPSTSSDMTIDDFLERTQQQQCINTPFATRKKQEDDAVSRGLVQSTSTELRRLTRTTGLRKSKKQRPQKTKSLTSAPEEASKLWEQAMISKSLKPKSRRSGRRCSQPSQATIQSEHQPTRRKSQDSSTQATKSEHQPTRRKSQDHERRPSAGKQHRSSVSPRRRVNGERCPLSAGRSPSASRSRSLTQAINDRRSGAREPSAGSKSPRLRNSRKRLSRTDHGRNTTNSTTDSFAANTAAEKVRLSRTDHGRSYTLDPFDTENFKTDPFAVAVNENLVDPLFNRAARVLENYGCLGGTC